MKNKIIFILKGLRITKNFHAKLEQNFHVLTVFEMIIYLSCIKPFWSKEKTFFFEGSLLLPGQMYIADRKALFNTIVEQKPDICFEVGTYTGGGSTYFLAEAFYKLKKGKVITIENDERLYNKARNYYTHHLPHLLPYVEFIHADNVEVFTPYLTNDVTSRSFFLDGAENAEQTLSQYEALLPHFNKGTILMAHDWHTDKMKSVRPLLENNPAWEKIYEVAPPQSVGFVAYVRK